MKWIKLYESFEDIDSICEKYGIKDYTINSDGSIDVDGDVGLYNRKLNKLPLKFGKVTGNFNCGYNFLTTLEGCPQLVGSYFNCSNNQLTKLEGGPQSVGGYFCCSHNKLISLEGGPQSVGGYFDCMINRLITLEGCPQSVGGYFNCSMNSLTTLEECPQSVGGYFNCYSNQLTSLEFCPQSVGGFFNFNSNKLKYLYGFPELFNGNIYYGFNPVSEILDLFKNDRLGKVIDLLNEYGVIQQDGKVVILDRLEEVFHTLNMEIPKEINLQNYEVY